MVLYDPVGGSLPFDGRNLKQVRESVHREIQNPFPPVKRLGTVLKRFLVINPKKRSPLGQTIKEK